MSENVRSIERAIEVMRELQTLESASLAQLQARTGLPKATLSRILQTLEKTRTVWRAKGDGLWRPAFEFKPNSYRTTPGPCRGCSASDGKPTSFGHLAI